MTLRERTEKSIHEKQQQIHKKWDPFIAERNRDVTELDNLAKDEVIVSGNKGLVNAETPTRFINQNKVDPSDVEKGHYLSLGDEDHVYH